MEVTHKDNIGVGEREFDWEVERDGEGDQKRVFVLERMSKRGEIRGVFVRISARESGYTYLRGTVTSIFAP